MEIHVYMFCSNMLWHIEWESIYCNSYSLCLLFSNVLLLFKQKSKQRFWRPLKWLIYFHLNYMFFGEYLWLKKGKNTQNNRNFLKTDNTYIFSWMYIWHRAVVCLNHTMFSSEERHCLIMHTEYKVILDLMLKVVRNFLQF